MGAAAAYLTPGDRGVFFEIDPAVVTLARAHFRYLPDADVPLLCLSALDDPITGPPPAMRRTLRRR